MTTAAVPLRDASDIARLLEAHAQLHALLCSVESLQLPDCWIGAGFVRNAVWDTLHGRRIDVSALDDVDVIFFDPAETWKARESGLEGRLRECAPNVTWSVKNQARMHHRNEDSPYRDTLDAVSHWPETATALAARMHKGCVEVMAPYGTADLIGLVVRPTPVFGHKLDIYRQRVASKNWPARWPRLKVLMTWEEAYPAPHSSFDRMDT